MVVLRGGAVSYERDTLVSPLQVHGEPAFRFQHTTASLTGLASCIVKIRAGPVDPSFRALAGRLKFTEVPRLL